MMRVRIQKTRRHHVLRTLLAVALMCFPCSAAGWQDGGLDLPESPPTGQLQGDEESQGLVPDESIAPVDEPEEQEGTERAADEALAEVLEAELDESVQTPVERLRVEWDERYRIAVEAGDLDRFYLIELRPLLRRKGAALERKLGGLGSWLPSRSDHDEDSEELEATFDELLYLYQLRSDVLPQLSGPVSRAVHGVGEDGRKELREELGYVLLGFQYQFRSVEEQREELALELVEREPIYALVSVLEVLVALFVFRWWRRWAPGRLEAGVSWFLARRPRRRLNLRMAAALWYLQRIRSPLEWLLLLSAVFTATGVSAHPSLNALWPIAEWILLARVAVLLLDAMATRGAIGARRESSRVRLRSLKLIATWFVVTGLGLDLARAFAGEAVLYAWVEATVGALLPPLVLLLIAWWRAPVFAQLESMRPQSSFTKGVLARRKGLEGFGATLVGGTFLFLKGLRRFVLRRVAAFDEGRRVLAGFAHAEALRLQERLGEFEGTGPLDEDLKRRLFDAQIEPIESYGRAALQSFVRTVEEGRDTTAILVGERGLGKSFFLRRLAGEIGQGVLIIDCPTGGFDAFLEKFAEALGIESHEPEVFSSVLAERKTKFVAIDNAHRLVRLYSHGHDDLDRLTAFAQGMTAKFLWLVVIDGSTWQFLQRVRASRNLGAAAIQLPAWSEEQLRALIEGKCKSIGIDPDFSHLVLPTRFDDLDVDDHEERNRSGYFRSLWTASNANPELAARLFADSLVSTPNGELWVRLFDRQLPEELQGLHLSVRLVLRYLAISELATPDEIDKGLRLGSDVVRSSLGLCVARGYVECQETHYRLTWEWFRAITQSLSRQNLLARSRAKVVQ